MRHMVFDTSSIISIATNNLLHLIKPLKARHKGEFYIVEGVRKEAIDVPLKGKRYKLEAIMVADLVNKGIIKSYENKDIVEKAEFLANLANNIFKARGNPIKLIHKGEIESLALACQLNGVLVVDERTMRLLVENAGLLLKVLKRKLHTNVFINKKILQEFKDNVCNVSILRSSELMTIAYELGLLDGYVNKKGIIRNKEELLDGLLWGLKLRGCSISSDEIRQILKLEKSRK